MAEQNSSQVSIGFKGGGLQFLGWAALSGILFYLVIPAAWGAVFFYRWLIRNITFSDGTKASLEGRASKVWGYFAIIAFLALGIAILSIAAENEGNIVSIGLNILLLPINAAIWLKIMRWLFSNVRLSCGTSLNFKGRYAPYLGWMFLSYISAYTIIGWAWVAVAFLRWVCRNIEGADNQLVFLGSGWGFLWRVIVAGLASIFIIPIPWMAVWIIRWVLRNMAVKKIAA